MCKFIKLDVDVNNFENAIYCNREIPKTTKPSQTVMQIEAGKFALMDNMGTEQRALNMQMVIS
jgi:hypothetical protein